MALSRISALLAATVVASLAVAATATPSNRQDEHDKYSYALITKNGDNTMSNWNYNSSDTSTNKLFKAPGPDRLYVKKDGNAQIYVITDPASISAVKKAMEPVQKIGRQQGAIGAKQSVIGAKQSKIGSQQGELGSQMGEIGRQMGELATHHNDDADYDKKSDALQQRMDALNKKMDVLNKQMEGPSKEQEKLGAVQDALGKKMDSALKIAEPKVEKIIDDAFAHGLAKAV